MRRVKSRRAGANDAPGRRASRQLTVYPAHHMALQTVKDRPLISLKLLWIMVQERTPAVLHTELQHPRSIGTRNSSGGTCVAVAQVGSCLSRLRPRRTNFSGDSPAPAPLKP